MSGPDLNDYLRLFALYEEVLESVDNPRSNRLELLFARVAAMLVETSPLNEFLPTTFINVAQRWHRGEPETRAHFDYDENRYFFLSDLRDYIQLQALRDRRQGG